MKKVLKKYCLVREEDGLQLKTFFSDFIEALLHAQRLTLITGFSYKVLPYIGK